MAPLTTVLKQPALTFQSWQVPAIERGGRCLIAPMTLNLGKGQWTALLGESGIGKTTLLRSLAGLDDPAVCHEPIRRVTYMAQQDSLLPWKNVLRNVMIGDLLRGQPVDEQRALAIIVEVGLEAKAYDYPQQLSVGMRHRVALARTLYEDADIVLLDEPFSSLDTSRKHKLHNLSKKMLAGKTVLHVTHDPLEAMYLADHILVMRSAPARVFEGFDAAEYQHLCDLKEILTSSPYLSLMDKITCTKL